MIILSVEYYFLNLELARLGFFSTNLISLPSIGFLKWTKVSTARGQNSLARMQREKLLASSQPPLTVHAFVHYATDRDLCWKFYRACVIFLAASVGMLRTCASEERISVSFSPCTRRISSFVARAVQTVSPDLSSSVRNHSCIFSILPLSRENLNFIHIWFAFRKKIINFSTHEHPSSLRKI